MKNKKLYPRRNLHCVCICFNTKLIYIAFQERGAEGLDYEEERTQFLQRVLLDYLAVNGQNDQALTYARHFYLAQWYWDSDAEKRRPSSGGKLSPNKLLSRKKKTRKKRKGSSFISCTLQSADSL